MLVLSV